MRALVSLVLALCFVSVSALASYDRADAMQLMPAAEAQLNLAHASSEAVAIDVHAAEPQAAGSGHECPCKKKSDSLTLSCGVTLGISGDDEGNCLPGLSKASFAFEHTDRKAERMYLLRRPPRNVL